MAMMHGNEREDVNFGGKILLPPTALAKLATLNIAYPMLFELKNESQQKTSHGGVLEFTAEEGKVYLPQWMMTTMLLEEGSLVKVKNVNLPLGKFVKLQPQSVDFLDISDPKAVLEKAISNFSTLTQGDIITIKYNNKQFDILIVESKPGGKGISVVETDLEVDLLWKSSSKVIQVDFAPPVGYVEPERQPRTTKVAYEGSTTSIEAHTKEDRQKFSAFHGSGQKLNGKAPAASSAAQGSASTPSSSTPIVETAKGKVPPALQLPSGKLFFGYPIIPLKGSETASENAAPTFTGSGQTLRAARKSGGSSSTSLTKGSSGSSSNPRP
ncbi:ubiquitin fusion degradation protein UFD1-domain-containing protein [Chytridium lagenaria]|nr:ubiquitin fusion degradation protein UFD1-domain-containing protein [Chytridium lagenaria]